MTYSKSSYDCRKCGNRGQIQLVIKTSPNPDHIKIGGFCGKCSNWIKWIGRDECINQTGRDLFEETRENMEADRILPTHDIPIGVPTSIALYNTEAGKDIVDFCQDLLRYVETDDRPNNSSKNFALKTVAAIVKEYKNF